jgi:O-antigen/teichoic acid export membrane protein
MDTNTQKKPSFMAIFLKGEAVSTFWNLVTKAIGLLNTFLTITSLTLYQYGVFQLLLSFSGVPSDVLNLGSAIISNEMSRAIADNRLSDAKRIFLEYSLVRIVITFIAWAIIFFGSVYIFKSYDIDFVKDMRMISFVILSEGLFVLIRLLCLVRLKFSVVAQRYTINKAIQSIVLIYYFLQGNLGLKQLILSIIIASSLSVLAVSYQFFKVYFKWSHVTVTPNVLLWNIFVTYGTWDVLRQFINKITFRVKPWLVKLFIGTEAVAIYSIAETIVTTIQDLIPSNTMQSLVPLWIKDKHLSVKMFSYGIKYFVLGSILVVISAIIVVPPVVYTFFSKYAQSIPLFYFMLLNLPIFAGGIIIGNYLIALRKQKYLFFLHFLRNSLTLGLIVSTLPIIGLWGLALEFVLVPLIMVIANYIYTKNQDKGFHFDFKIIFGFKEEDKIILRKGISIVRGWFVRYGLLAQ